MKSLGCLQKDRSLQKEGTLCKRTTSWAANFCVLDLGGFSRKFLWRKNAKDFFFWKRLKIIGLNQHTTFLASSIYSGEKKMAIWSWQGVFQLLGFNFFVIIFNYISQLSQTSWRRESMGNVGKSSYKHLPLISKQCSARYFLWSIPVALCWPSSISTSGPSWYF